MTCRHYSRHIHSLVADGFMGWDIVSKRSDAKTSIAKSTCRILKLRRN
jgi:hypothetical protein